MDLRRPEVLAPAGDDESLRAAVRAGADAVYFGLQGFNARARAKNFDAAQLSATMGYLHEHGVKGYVTLNTLVFDAELPNVEAAVRTCAEAGVDAVIVQDLGVAKIVREIAPELPIHASTQMTCTDAASVDLARSLGASRVILARELTVDDIAAIRARTDVELEVFVHGALCVAYSGQCLTSEAIGGRSANRGACAQACRLPYELLVDGEVRDLGDRAYLLSPEDLEASSVVQRLVELGISSLKIEGRLKGAAYVASTTQLYRAAIDAAFGARDAVGTAERDRALQTYSRGSGPGFLAGIDHQRLVEARGCDHRGLHVGDVLGTARSHGKTCLRVKLARDVARGDGVLAEGGLANAGELGGRVWSLRVRDQDVERATAGTEALVWLGPERAIPADFPAQRRLFKTNDPAREHEILATIARDGQRVPIDVRVHGAIGEHPVFEARTARGAQARVVGDVLIERALQTGRTVDVLRDKLSRLGDSPFELASLDNALPDDALVAASSINRARRALVDQLVKHEHARHWSVTSASHLDVIARAAPPDRAPPASGLFVLCRTLEQAEAAIDAGADGVYLDFLELTGTGNAVRSLRARGPVHITLAPPRIRKPGEEKIDRFLESLEPDALLVRSLGALRDGAETRVPRIGDFSLNVTNRITASEVMAHDLAAFTPSFDLDAAQLLALLDTPFAPFAEVVVHHPMPLFHMEHCVFAALLSNGHDHRDCGRPCEKHQISLRDRAGMAHPVEADVGCRNTVFHAASQSAAGVATQAARKGVRRFRIELVREGRHDVAQIVTSYRALLDGTVSAQDVWRTLRTESGYGVVKGTLRVLGG